MLYYRHGRANTPPKHKNGFRLPLSTHVMKFFREKEGASIPVPNKLDAWSRAMGLERGNAGMVKYEVRSTKYEVRE